MKVVFVGRASAEIVDTPFKFIRYGQLVDIPDELAKEAMANRVALATPEEFAEVNHTETELKKYSNFNTNGNTPPDFDQKVFKLHEKVRSRHGNHTPIIFMGTSKPMTGEEANG